MAIRRTFESLALLVGIVIVWQAASAAQLFSPSALPSPVAVAYSAWHGLLSGELFENVWASLLRFIVGYAVGVGLAVPMGLLIGCSKWVDELTQIPLNTLRQVPGLAWIPIAVLWFGIGNTTALFVLILASFFPTVINTAVGARNVDRNLMRAALTLGAHPNSLLLFRKVVLPGALPMVLAGLRISVGAAWTAIVAAEMVAAQSGVGFVIQYYRRMIEVEQVILYMLVIGILGLVLDQLIRLVQRRALAWQMNIKVK